MRRILEGYRQMAKAKELKRVKNKEFFNYKRRRGDRRDGWRIYSSDPFFGVIPHIMPNRTGSMVQFDETIDTTELDSFVRRMRRDTDMTDLSRLAIMCAALVRVYSQYPNLNRFVVGRRIYARNHIAISMIVKRAMVLGGDEIAIKPCFMPNATLHDVWEQLHAEIAKNKEDTSDNSTDGMAKLLNSLPVWLVRSVVNFFTRADNHNHMTKLLNDLSPFHASMFITDIGSAGISAVYHHLYDFGTCSQFIALGKREKKLVMGDDGQAKEVNAIGFKYVVDERIVDGFYYAKAMRYFLTLMKHPEQLLTAPEKVNEDPLC